MVEPRPESKPETKIEDLTPAEILRMLGVENTKDLSVEVILSALADYSKKSKNGGKEPLLDDFLQMVHFKDKEKKIERDEDETQEFLETLVSLARQAIQEDKPEKPHVEPVVPKPQNPEVQKPEMSFWEKYEAFINNLNNLSEEEKGEFKKENSEKLKKLYAKSGELKANIKKHIESKNRTKADIAIAELNALVEEIIKKRPEAGKAKEDQAELPEKALPIGPNRAEDLELPKKSAKVLMESENREHFTLSNDVLEYLKLITPEISQYSRIEVKISALKKAFENLAGKKHEFGLEPWEDRMLNKIDQLLYSFKEKEYREELKSRRGVDELKSNTRQEDIASEADLEDSQKSVAELSKEKANEEARALREERDAQKKAEEQKKRIVTQKITPEEAGIINEASDKIKLPKVKRETQLANRSSELPEQETETLNAREVLMGLNGQLGDAIEINGMDLLKNKAAQEILKEAETPYEVLKSDAPEELANLENLSRVGAKEYFQNRQDIVFEGKTAKVDLIKKVRAVYGLDLNATKDRLRGKKKKDFTKQDSQDLKDIKLRNYIENAWEKLSEERKEGYAKKLGLPVNDEMVKFEFAAFLARERFDNIKLNFKKEVIDNTVKTLNKEPVISYDLVSKKLEQQDEKFKSLWVSAPTENKKLSDSGFDLYLPPLSEDEGEGALETENSDSDLNLTDLYADIELPESSEAAESKEEEIKKLKDEAWPPGGEENIFALPGEPGYVEHMSQDKKVKEKTPKRPEKKSKKKGFWADFKQEAKDFGRTAKDMITPSVIAGEAKKAKEDLKASAAEAGQVIDKVKKIGEEYMPPIVAEPEKPVTGIRKVGRGIARPFRWALKVVLGTAVISEGIAGRLGQDGNTMTAEQAANEAVDELLEKARKNQASRKKVSKPEKPSVGVGTKKLENELPKDDSGEDNLDFDRDYAREAEIKEAEDEKLLQKIEDASLDELVKIVKDIPGYYGATYQGYVESVVRDIQKCVARGDDAEIQALRGVDFNYPEYTPLKIVKERTIELLEAEIEEAKKSQKEAEKVKVKPEAGEELEQQIKNAKTLKELLKVLSESESKSGQEDAQELKIYLRHVRKDLVQALDKRSVAELKQFQIFYLTDLSNTVDEKFSDLTKELETKIENKIGESKGGDFDWDYLAKVIADNLPNII